MLSPFALRIAFLFVVLLSVVASSAHAQTFDSDAKPLLASHCYECHNPDNAKGDLDLTKFRDADRAARSPDVWEGVVQRVTAREMPPKKSKKQFTVDEQDKLLKGLKSLARVELDCSQFANDETQRSYRGHVMSRRLNRAEYNNTLRDLLGGLDVRTGDDLPADGAGGEGFDTVGDALFTSAIHVEKYLDAAERGLDLVLGDPKAGARLFGEPAVATARKTVLVATPDGETSPRAAADKVVTEFARRAWRRPVVPAEVERYLKLFDKAADRGDSFDHAVKLALQGVLISPNFLFLIEPESVQDGTQPLGPFPMASRLSYFLWASMPDEELFRLAADGKLQDDETLRGQVRRMLKDPRARGLAERFATQWLGLAGLGETVRPDAKLYPEFNDRLAAAMRQEAVLLFERVIREDRPLAELLDADYTFVNEDLARLYELPGVRGTDLRLVKLPDRTRGGILGLAAVHVTTSYPLRTSPVLRGKWVLGDVLGSRVPPPPPDAGELPADGKSPDGLSLRKQLELHREKAECASCHDKMDPLGFGLENFDVLGRWRSADADGQPIDAAGTLPGGETFAGPAELKQVLLKRKGEFHQNLCRKLLGYALGRDLRAGSRRPGQFDQCVVDDCLKGLEKVDGRSGVVFETIALSKPFRYRYKAK